MRKILKIGIDGYPLGFNAETLTAWQQIYENREAGTYREYWAKAPAAVKIIASGGDLSFVDDPVDYFSWGTSDPAFAAPFGGIDRIRSSGRARLRDYAMISHLLTADQRAEIESGWDRVIQYLVFERDITNSLSDSDLILASTAMVALYRSLIMDARPDRAAEILGGNMGGITSPGEPGTFRSATYRIFTDTMNGSDPESDGIFWPEGVQYSTGTRPGVMSLFRILEQAYGEDYFPEAMAGDIKLAYGHLQYLTNNMTSIFMFGDAGGGKEYANFNYNKLPEIVGDYGLTGDPVFSYAFDRMDELGDRRYLNRYTGFDLHATPDLNVPDEEYFLTHAPTSAWDKNKSVSIWRTGWSTDDTAVLSMLAQHNGVEHWPYYDTIQVWRKGQWVLDDHRGYCGANVFNHGWTTAFYPWGGRALKKHAVVGYERGDNWVYHEGVSYGPMDNIKWAMPESVHEHSRAMFFRRNTDGTDTMIVFDRIDVEDSHPEDAVDEDGVPLNFLGAGRLISYFRQPAEDAGYRHEFNWLPLVDNLTDLSINGNAYSWGDDQVTELNILMPDDQYEVRGPYVINDIDRVTKTGSRYPNFMADMNSNAKYRYSNLRVQLTQRSGFQTAMHALTFRDADQTSPTYERIETDMISGVRVTTADEVYAVLFSRVPGLREDDLIVGKRHITVPVTVDLDGVDKIYMAHAHPAQPMVINGVGYQPTEDGFVVADLEHPDPEPEPEPEPEPTPDPEPEPTPEPAPTGQGILETILDEVRAIREALTGDSQ